MPLYGIPTYKYFDGTSSKDQYTNSATCDFILLSQLEFHFYLELGIGKLRFFL